MAISQQKINAIYIKALKNIHGLELSFEGKKVTAILGPNGNGKSTVLHALACAFQPVINGENHKFSNFFLPHTDALWQGSELVIKYSFRNNAEMNLGILQRYCKTSDRWTPRYDRRPKRDIYYIGIDKCVPLIESEKKQARINYSTQEVTEEVINVILNKASYILNMEYTAFNIHSSGNKKFIGVESNGLRYSALSMSAGEQKIFLILEKLFRAEKYSLFLIDEIDLLLHDAALKKLIKVIHERAEDKGIQVVFTTHRETILDLSDMINIRHLIKKGSQTLCFSDTKPDAIARLTGEQPRPIDIFVEDDLAMQIVQKIASTLKMSRFVSVHRYGAAMNCFTVLGGLLVDGDECEITLFVLDGDVYREDTDKIKHINGAITGTGDHVNDLRARALPLIKQFSLPVGAKPERYIHGIISNMDETGNDEFDEIIEIAKEIIVVDNSHKYVDDIIEKLGYDRSRGLSKIIDLLSTSDEWDGYIEEINDWLSPHVPNMRENA